MRKKYLSFVILALLVIPLIGCGVKNVLPSKPVPPLDGYSKIVLLPFSIKNSSGNYDNLPTLLSYGIGTKLAVRHQDLEWIFDQSQEITPVSDKMKELNISIADVENDPLMAVKVAEAFEADLAMVGKIDEPNFTRQDSGKIKYVMSEMTPAGTARYYTIYQTATLSSDVILVDVKANLDIWDGRIVGYKKYETDYKTGSPKKFERDETMLADIRKDYVAKFVEKLYPLDSTQGK